MKKLWVIIVNISIMVTMLVFVAVYSALENKKTTRLQIEHFENTTITMEHVTENYLEGEQRLCDVWAHYINSQIMIIEEAASFIRISHVLPNASAHLVYLDNLDELNQDKFTEVRYSGIFTYAGASDAKVIRYFGKDGFSKID